MKRREIGQMEPLGKGQACIYEVKGRQYGREGEVRPQGVWVGGHTEGKKDPRLGNQSNLDSPLCITLEYYLISLSICFFTCKYELIPVFQGHGDQVMEHMENYPAQSRQLITIRASSFQFTQSQALPFSSPKASLPNLFPWVRSWPWLLIVWTQ